VLGPAIVSTAVQGTVTVEDTAGKAVSEIRIQIPIERPYASWTEVAAFGPSGEAAYLVVESPPGASISLVVVPSDTPLPPQASP
jgi:hypothetical protein